MYRILMLVGLVLFLPGACALGYSVFQGPSSWMTDARTFWGTPISLFVFWIGLAHAGTLISAIFLALDIKLDRRTALIAELSTLASLVIAAVFPLVHLGIVKNFYMVAPLLDLRGNFANIRSPLVWDFCCIAVYAALSLLFFATHLKARRNPTLEKYCKPMAWLLFPLVLWVHTVVSLDFATTFVPEWRGAFFPVYFITGAIFSGLALVNLLLCAEGYRVRLLERLQLICSWILCAIWAWEFMLKGTFCASAFIFAGLLPQLRMVAFIRESKWGRMAISASVLLGLFLERQFLVSPEFGSPAMASFGWVDWGMLAFSAGTFMLVFFGMLLLLKRFMEVDGSYFGEVDGRDIAEVEEAEHKDSPVRLGVEKTKKGFYVHPWSSEEYHVLRLPLLLGIAFALLFSLWAWGRMPFENVDLSLANVIPLFYPVVALVTAVALYARAYFVEKAFALHRIEKILAASVLVLAGTCAGAFYAGGASERGAARDVLSENPENRDLPVQTWNARCATCHGSDGKFNEKFVREFYPVPQKLDLLRLDSLGEDSLVNVILKGRVNMNAYEGRLTYSDALGLVRYMRSLAEKEVANDSAP
jgi:hypothetical protein